MKDVVIISHFTSTFSKTDNDRFLYLAKRMYKDCNVEIVTSDFCHEKKSHRLKTEVEWPFLVTFLHEPGYPKNVCIKRLFSHFIWGMNVKRYLKTRKKPDVIYCAVPSLTGPFMAARYCRKKATKFIIDVQDLWPEAFQLVLNIPIITDLAFLPMKAIANTIYKSADEIVAVSKTYADRALRSNLKKLKAHSVFLGTDLSIFDNNTQKECPLSKEDELWLAYCGTLGSSYDLTCVFDALKILKDAGKVTPKFIVMGDGPFLEKFKSYSESLGLNVLFTGRIPYDDMCAILSRSDIAVNPIMHGAAQSIINKHADYVASGKPIISTQENEEFRTLVQQYDMGDNCDNNNSKQMAELIEYYCNNKTVREEKGNNARKCAEKLFDRANSYRTIMELIKED